MRPRRAPVVRLDRGVALARGSECVPPAGRIPIARARAAREDAGVPRYELRCEQWGQIVLEGGDRDGAEVYAVGLRIVRDGRDCNRLNVYLDRKQGEPIEREYGLARLLKALALMPGREFPPAYPIGPDAEAIHMEIGDPIHVRATARGGYSAEPLAVGQVVYDSSR